MTQQEKEIKDRREQIRYDVAYLLGALEDAAKTLRPVWDALNDADETFTSENASDAATIVWNAYSWGPNDYLFEDLENSFKDYAAFLEEREHDAANA